MKNNLLEFCIEHELPFVPVSYVIKPDAENEGFYKKKMNLPPKGWKDWTINKCLEYYRQDGSDFILIDLKNKFCVIDTDSEEQTRDICNYFYKRIKKSFSYFLDNWVSHGTSHYLTTDDKPIKDAHYKFHFWLTIDRIKPTHKIDSVNKIDIITKHICEHVDSVVNINASPLLFCERVYKKVYGIKYEEKPEEPNFTYNDLTYDQKCIYDNFTKYRNPKNKNIDTFKKYLKKHIIAYQNKSPTKPNHINEYRACQLFYYNTFVNNNSVKTDNIITCYEMYFELFNIIDISHIENFGDWTIIGMVINTLNLDFSEKVLLFTDVSRLSSKYKNQSEKKCREMLLGFEASIKTKVKILSIATIKWWAKKENLSEYNKWLAKWNVGSASNIDDIIICQPSNHWNFNTINSKYLPTIDIKDGITMIKSHLGTGKTTFITKFIKDHLDKKIIVITPREIYAQNQHAELNKVGLDFRLYQDYQNDNIDRVICQVESLHKFNDIKYDIIIMDECESILKQFSSLDTHGTNYSTNCDVFYNLIKDSSKVIMADAFITNRSKVFVDNFKKPIFYYDNIFNPYDRLCIKHPIYQSFVSDIINSIDNGLKVCVLWASKNKGLKFIESDLFKTVMKGKKYYFYHGDRDKKYNESIKNVNETWADAELVMYTTKITVGVNFDKLVYDRLYIYGTPDSATVRDIFQGSLRVRHLKENLLHYYIETENTFAKNQVHITDIDEIETKLNNNKYEVENFDKELNVSFKDMPRWLREVHIRNIYESNINKAYYEKVFNKYLSLCGYKKKNQTKFVDIGYEPGEIKVYNLYDDVKTLTKDEFIKLKTKSKQFYELTNDEKEQMHKYRFNKLFDMDKITKNEFPINKLYNKYFVENTDQKTFYNFISELKSNETKVYLNETKHQEYAELVGNNHKKLKEIKEIVSLLGLKNSLDDTDISPENLNKAFEYMRPNFDKLNSIFNLRERKESEDITNRNLTELLNKILDSWCNGKLKKGNERQIRCPKLKKRIRVIDYKIQNQFFDKPFYEYVIIPETYECDFIKV